MNPALEIETDPLKLSHEIHVHQIELEIQNEELRRTRDELEAVLSQYADLYDFAPVGYCTLDREGKITRTNFAAATLLGLDRARLVNQRFELFVARDARPTFTLFFEKALVIQAKESCEVSLSRVGRPPLFLQIEAEPAASGQTCLLALIDITNRKLASHSTQKVDEIVNSALRRCEESVEAALRLVEAAAAEALQKTDGATAAPEAIELARLKVEEAAETARLKVEEATEEARLTVKEAAETLYLDKEATKGAVLKVTVAAERERRKVERALAVARRTILDTESIHNLRREKELLEVSIQGKSQFLANMSHELRTPMTGVLGMLDLVLLGNLETEQRELLNAAHLSAHSLVLILNDILDMTKMALGKFSIVAQPFSLRECVKRTYNILIPTAKSKGLELNLTVAANVPEIFLGDQARLSQVLTNLAGNAVKFTKQGKVEISVSAVGTTDGQWDVTMAITDTGIGIPVAKKDIVFLAFSQVDESHSRSYGGTGLGLALSKEIVESMGGEINFTSEEGKGSTFSCTIPFHEVEAVHDPDFVTKSSATTAAAPGAEGEKVRLLVAEDDEITQLVIGRLLRKFHYEVDFAENGQLAVEMWEKGEYSLILMDIQMPVMSGFEATAAIRERERTGGGHIPIVAMTAHALKEDKDKCLDAGMDAYLSKPIDFAKTLQVIGQFLNQQTTGDGALG